MSPPKEPPTGSPASSRPSSTPARSSSYFSYPVSYAVSGILRRLSTEPASKDASKDSSHSLQSQLQSQLQSTATSISHSFASLLDSSTSADMQHVYQSPQRTASPFQPPPLSPLSLLGYEAGMREKGKLLSRALAEEIRLLVPPRLQIVDEWTLLYSLEQNGVSLGTLYQKSDEYRGKRGGFVLVVRDGDGGVFGAYLSDAPRPAPYFYGNGECFLWRAHVLTSLPDLANLPPPPSADTTHAVRMTTVGTTQPKSDKLAAVKADHASRSGTSTPERIRFKAFPYSGINDYMIFCEQSFLSVGGGDGHYGLWLDDSLENGVSDTCPTFGNEPLSDDGKKFKVMGVEMWYIGS